MKQKIHPNWHDNAVVNCACGNTFETGSIQETIQVDICAACHPFFTGEMKFVDRQGRVDKFKKKMAAAQVAKKNTSKKKTKQQSQAEQKSYKQLLGEERVKIKKTAKAQDN
jgi:large subunit ribosomal protein L31